MFHNNISYNKNKLFGGYNLENPYLKDSGWNFYRDQQIKFKLKNEENFDRNSHKVDMMNFDSFQNKDDFYNNFSKQIIQF